MTITVIVRKACTRDQNLDQQGFPVLHRRGKAIKRDVVPLFSVAGEFLSGVQSKANLACSRAFQAQLSRQELYKLFGKCRQAAR